MLPHGIHVVYANLTLWLVIDIDIIDADFIDIAYLDLLMEVHTVFKQRVCTNTGVSIFVTVKI